MSFFCPRLSIKGSWTPQVFKGEIPAQAPNGRVTIANINGDQIRNNINHSKTTYRQSTSGAITNETKTTSSLVIQNSNNSESNPQKSLERSSPLLVRRNTPEAVTVTNRTPKKKLPAPVPLQNSASLSTLSEAAQKNESTVADDQIEKNKTLLNDSTNEIREQEFHSQSETISRSVVPNGVHNQDENNARKSMHTSESDDEIKTNQPNLSVHSLSQEERISIDVQVRRRSKIIPRPVTFNENDIKKLPVYPKDARDEELIKEALLANEFLGKLLKEGKRLQDVINAMYSRDVSPNEVIIKEGETGSHMYVSVKGNFEVTIAKQGVVSSFDDSRVFGELALLHSAKRLATVTATKHGKVWVLDQHIYNQLMVRTNIEEQDEILSFLQKVEKLNSVKSEVLRHVAKLLIVEYFKGGTEIVRQGEKGDKFYIIRAGSVTITRENEGIVNNFGKGKYFGELALLKEDTRQATVIADPPAVECFTLTRKQFITHFGEVDDIANITISTHQPKLSVIKSPASEFDDIDLGDLEIKATLGVGGFGRVELVQHMKRSELTFALKYLKKHDMVEQQQEEHVKNEKKIQMACKSIFIVRLFRTYKDAKYLYFLMETCLGGDLWNLLQKQKGRRFEEKNARFIAACVIEAIAYLHERDIVYRDLKPENLMIDSEGYVKLTDFGFAKKLSPGDKTYTFAGTPEYVSPEIVLNRGHDKSVDYWAFGIFVYELLSGRTPFRTGDPNHMKTYNRILNGIDKVQFPSYIVPKAKHIIEKLCRPLPMERLGYQRGGVKDIKNHKWFLGFDWMKLNDHKLVSPFKPKLIGNTDTHYFDTFKKDYDIPPDETSGWDYDF